MDIKEKIKSIVETLKSNPAILKDFEKDPVKVIETLIDADLPDDVVEKIIEGVKAMLVSDKVSDLAGKFKKLF